MWELKDFAKDFILIESLRVLRRHTKDEKEADKILKDKFKLDDKKLREIKEKEKQEKDEKRWSI